MDRRRSVMQPIHDPSINIRSNIPLPSTLHKPAPTSTSRISLAGPALRTSNLTVPGTNPRQSMARPQNTNPLLQSTSKPNYGKTPLSNSTLRRGSVWGGGATAAAPSGSQIIKDNRPLRERSYQAKMRQDVYNYLNSAGFEISMQALSSMQGKDYRAVFNSLILNLDPFYAFKEGARFEEEFIPALKAVRYPFVHHIDSKWLAAVASPHSWPYLLGVLHWLVELCQLRNQYLVSGHPTIQDAASVPEEFDDPLDRKALAFQYIEDCYSLWLDHHDEFTECNNIIEERYQKRNERVQNELDDKTKLLAKLNGEYKKLQSSAPSISETKKDSELLQKDLEKLKIILERYEARRDKLIDQIAVEKVELSKRTDLLTEQTVQLEKLTNTIRDQNLSPEEVIKMNTDRETLQRNLEDLRQKVDESKKVILNQEVTLANRVTTVEEALDTYTGMLTTLGLYPTPPEPWQDIDLTLELNSASSNPQQLLIGTDVRKVIRPTLSSVAESKRQERATIESESVKVNNDLDQSTIECKNLDYDMSEIEKKVVQLNEQADDLRDAAQQEAQFASDDVSRLDRELGQARMAAIANGLGVKSRLAALQFSYKEQVEKVSRLKEETVRAILKNSQEIANFKQEVSKHLQDLRDFAEADDLKVTTRSS